LDESDQPRQRGGDRASPGTGPDWAELRTLAAAQGGFFAVRQAAQLGFSPQLLASHVRNGRLLRARRGIYRLAQFPPVEHDDLVELWLWSQREGVFSHETALALHELSDALPTRVHLTLPRGTTRRSTPDGVVLHRADIPDADRMWIGLVPVTTPGRTLRDAVDDGIHPSLIEQAAREGTARGLLQREELRGIVQPRRGRPRKPRSEPR
jgi:predicted transcriptional regulator of viral defense system